MCRSLFLMFATAALMTCAGCQCCRSPVAVQKAVVPGSPCPPGNPCPPGGIGLPPPPAPIGGQPKIFAPPPNFPNPNPGGVPTITPPPGGAPPPNPPGTTPYTPGNASLGPPELHWQPATGQLEPGKVTPAIPDPLLGSTMPGAGSGPRLFPPETGEKSTPEPPLIVEEKVKPADKKAKFPVGIAQFAPATAGVWNGGRPSIDDGLDWLAANGYRTVLHLRGPADPDHTDRKQIEKLGMAYLSIEITPQTLTRERLDEFAKLVRDAARQPMFVYDQDGSLTGSMWYLFFRKIDNDNDDLARIRANPLGLREDREGTHRLMWLAVQQYLANNP